jgi:MFS family permease
MFSWRRNLVVLCFAQMLTMMGFSSYFPIIPFYLQELGATTTAEATAWLAAFSSGAAIAMAIASPIWGGLSDRYGRKVMLVRATFFGALLAYAMGLVQTPMQLIVLRILQGILCGTVTAAVTLVATQTPEEHLGFSLGAMQTAQFVGQALGPLVGGTIADTTGIRSVFPVSAGMMTLSFLAVALLAREKREPHVATAAARVAAKPAEPAPNAVRAVLSRNTLVLLLALGSISLAIAVVSPFMSLYIQELSPGSERIATLAGAAVSISALTSAVAAMAIGRLGDKVGQKAVLLACGFAMALVHVPQALVSNTSQLLLLRALQGVFMGGMTPTANALLAKTTPPERRGTVFGMSNSFTSAGRAMGPAIGASVAGTWGMPPVFLVTAALFATVSAMVAIFVKPTAPVAERLAAAAAESVAPVEGC